ncbi:MAG: nucleotidyltransferase domain-containing protein [Bacteroidales bacterium]|nr:nucleotidyltransferase domain-containing protein [Bacteroidales bacterium]
MERTKVIENIKQVAMKALPPSSSLILYGSRARGDYKDDSDWDLLILLDKPELSDSDYDNVSFPFTLLGWNIGELISPQMYTKKEWDSISFLPFYKNVERDKIVLV